MTENIPEKIFLIIGDTDNDYDFNKLSEVSWAKEKIYDNDIEYILSTKELLPNPSKSTENLSKIKDKDKWLNELRGKDEELIYKIKYATAGMCISDLSANRCAKEATEIALQYFKEKVKCLHNKYDHGEVNDIYNLAIFDVLELLK